MKALTLLLLLALRSWGANVQLAWDAPNDPSITGYRVYYGLSSGDQQYWVDAGQGTNVSVPNLYPGTTYYFVCESYDVNGIKSLPSNEVSWWVRLAPPTRLRITKQEGLVVTDVEYTTNLVEWNQVVTVMFTNTYDNGVFRAKSVGY